MPLRQSTFTLVPMPGRSYSPQPPMTSKAVRKAYRERQGPKLSKEEQRRQTQAHLKRIRDELESEDKERAQEHTRATRERKRKEKAEKMEAQKQA